MIRVLVIMGPTGGGKSALALDLAEACGREIVSADSRQVYRGLRIGTAQPSAAERGRAPHHLIDFLPVRDRYSAQRFVDDALPLIRARPEAPPLVVGGTGLYLRSLWRGLFALEADPAALAQVRAELSLLPNEELAARLALEDPESARRLHPRDRQRMIRALEVKRVTGRPLSEHQRQGQSGPGDIQWVRVLVQRRREALRARIAARTREMLAAGWVEEVRELLAGGAEPTSPGMQSLGYPQIAAVLAGRMSVSAAEERIVQLTGQFAKRQETWFAREAREATLDPDGASIPAQLMRLLAG